MRSYRKIHVNPVWRRLLDGETTWQGRQGADGAGSTQAWVCAVGLPEVEGTDGRVDDRPFFPLSFFMLAGYVGMYVLCMYVATEVYLALCSGVDEGQQGRRGRTWACGCTSYG